MANKLADGKAIRAGRAAAASVAVLLALGAGAVWTAQAGTTADPGGGSEAQEAPAGPVAGFEKAQAGVGNPGGWGRFAGDGGDPSGSALVQSAADSRSPSIVGDGQVGRERVAGGGALVQSATDSRSPTLD